MSQTCDVLLLDISSLFFRSYTALQVETEETHEDCSGIVGTIQTIESQIKTHNPKIVVGVYDGKNGSKKKKKLFSDYKAGRKLPIKISAVHHERTKEDEEKARENFLQQQRSLFEYLSFLPIHQIVVTDYEADEILAYVNEHYFQDWERVIVTGDKDFQQLITETCNIFHLYDKKTKDLDALEKTWGTRNGHIVTILRCIIGDDSDKINGIYGLGLKTIQKNFPKLSGLNLETLGEFKEYLLSYKKELEEQTVNIASNWKTVLANIEHLLEGNDKKTGEKCWSILERNYELMQLFHPELDKVAIDKIHKSLRNPVSFQSQEFRKKAILEGINFQSHKYGGWELGYKDLVFNMKHAEEKLKNLIGEYA